MVRPPVPQFHSETMTGLSRQAGKWRKHSFHASMTLYENRHPSGVCGSPGCA